MTSHADDVYLLSRHWLATLTDRYGPMADVEATRDDEWVGAEVKLQLAGVA